VADAEDVSEDEEEEAMVAVVAELADAVDELSETSVEALGLARAAAIISFEFPAFPSSAMNCRPSFSRRRSGSSKYRVTNFSLFQLRKEAMNNKTSASSPVRLQRAPLRSFTDLCVRKRKEARCGGT
jgi:hypothetical protein